MPRHHVFTLTAGRTGTRWLAEMLGASLPRCTAHHEILGYDRFGLDAPDLSHLTLFNSKGCCPEVRAFWERKFARVRACETPWYVETSHQLMKAGLVEHLDLLGDGEVHLILLTRDMVETVLSYTQRGDFNNVGNQWLWYLDPEYPQNILDAGPFTQHGVLGIRMWYWLEIAARQGYYAALLADRPGVTLHRCDLAQVRTEAGARALLADLGADPDGVRLPAPSNTTPASRRLGERERELVGRLCRAFTGDAGELGAAFHARGRRLGAPPDAPPPAAPDR
jgi:hypothetical protein